MVFPPHASVCRQARVYSHADALEEHTAHEGMHSNDVGHHSNCSAPQLPSAVRRAAQVPPLAATRGRRPGAAAA